MALAGHSADCRLSAGAIYLSIVYTCNASVYMLPAAIYSACNFVTIFVTKYRTLIHAHNIRSLLKPPCPLSTFVRIGPYPLPLRADILYGCPFLVADCRTTGSVCCTQRGSEMDTMDGRMADSARSTNARRMAAVKPDIVKRGKCSVGDFSKKK